MKKRIGLLFSIILVFSVVLAACTPGTALEATEVVVEPTDIPPTDVPTEMPEPQAAIVVEDDLGFEIVLDEPAQAVISISPNLTEILYAVGAGESLIGRDSNSMYPEEALAESVADGDCI